MHRGAPLQCSDTEWCSNSGLQFGSPSSSVQPYPVGTGSTLCTIRPITSGVARVDLLNCGDYSARMGDSAPAINITADAIEYAEQKFLRLFGKDRESKELANWFRGLQQTALAQTASVSCLGMRKPVPFDSIYQPNRVLVSPDEDEAVDAESSFVYEDRVSRSILRGLNQKSITVEEFLKRDQDALVFGFPGWGKTTFLRHIFRSTVNSDDILPVLISLRRPTAVDDLEHYVDACSRIQKKQHRACTLLLVDGYDEISHGDRRRVTEALLKFQAQRAGKFYLTCREYYQVASLNAPEVRLDRFRRDDQIRFVKVFLSNFAIMRDDPEKVVNQLEVRGFEGFLSHPLLLTLACIVRTSSTSVQPRSALRLLERAFEVLCFKWDQEKYIDRTSTTPLDGPDRIRLLKHIAYKATSPFVPQQRAEEIAKRQLGLLGWEKVEPRTALLEIAQFYGILVPAEDGYEFVHRTIHDFLAAKQWVESGDFAKQYNFDWNARTGYAACLISDATDVLKKALESHHGLPAATEIIGNYAAFDCRTIAEAVVNFFYHFGGVVQYERRDQSERFSHYGQRIAGRLSSDFIRLANADFLDGLVAHCCERNTQVSNLLVAYAVTELHARMMKLQPTTYKKTVVAYGTELITFAVPGAKEVQLKLLNPILENRMKDYKRPAG